MLEKPTAKGPKLEFTFHHSLSPFASNQKAYLSEHPHEGYQFIATGALVFENTDSETPRILLIQRSASDSMPNRWEVPGGGCDDEDESILHAVARELWEEAGLEATDISGPVGKPHLFTSRSGKQICKFNFMVQVEQGAEPKLNPEEHQKFLWASESEVKLKRVQDVDLKFTTKELEDTVLLAFGQFHEE